MLKIANYINGQLKAPSSRDYLDNYSPTNGQVYSLVPDSGPLDVDDAVAAAKKAFLSWSVSDKEFRYDWMMKLADAIDAFAERLVVAESFDNGKPEWLARTMDIPRCSANIRFFATSILHFDAKFHHTNPEAFNYTLKQPVGVAGCISPWNLPLYLLTWKIAPAIAVGNTVIAKPSEVTPYTAYLFSKICKKINFPKGVINIVHGRGEVAGSEVVQKSDIVSFTGGTQTGKLIAATVAASFKKCSLELGGKNPIVVFSDCNFKSSIETVARAAFLNQGQICLSGSRVFIQKSIYTKFKLSLLKKIQSLVVGDPKKPSSNLGAVVSESHLNKILKYVKLAKKEGGKILCGGNRVVLKGDLSGGYYMAPTVIEQTRCNDTINQEEVFGPVITIFSFESENEVVKMCNSTRYGLSASVFSKNISKAHRIAAKIDAGVVWINTWLLRDLRIPFGGMKHSGVGREGGYDSLNFFTETKNVCVKIEKS